MTDPIADIIGDYRGFAAQQRDRLLTRGIDIASKKALGKFTLSTANTRVRIWGLDVDPQERFAVLLVKTYAKQLDRFVVGKPTLLRYDLLKHAVCIRPRQERCEPRWRRRNTAGAQAPTDLIERHADMLIGVGVHTDRASNFTLLSIAAG